MNILKQIELKEKDKENQEDFLQFVLTEVIVYNSSQKRTDDLKIVQKIENVFENNQKLAKYCSFDCFQPFYQWFEQEQNSEIKNSLEKV